MVVSILTNRLQEALNLLDEKLDSKSFYEFKNQASLEKENNTLKEENERLLKELREYEILVSNSDLDNFNPAHFQKEMEEHDEF